jgi:hypothetical protein
MEVVCQAHAKLKSNIRAATIVANVQKHIPVVISTIAKSTQYR